VKERRGGQRGAPASHPEEPRRRATPSGLAKRPHSASRVAASRDRDRAARLGVLQIRPSVLRHRAGAASRPVRRLLPRFRTSPSRSALLQDARRGIRALLAADVRSGATPRRTRQTSPQPRKPARATLPHNLLRTPQIGGDRAIALLEQAARDFRTPPDPAARNRSSSSARSPKPRNRRPFDGSYCSRCSSARANVSATKSNTTSGSPIQLPTNAVTALTWRS
jgi:hypothetical protein